MILLSQFEEIAESFKNMLGLKEYFVTSTAEQTQNLLKDRSGTAIVCVIPSTFFEGPNADASKDTNESIVYIVQKERDGQAHAKQLQQYKETQAHIIKIKDLLLGLDEDECKTFPFIEIRSMMIDPEYNIFGGWVGWSIKFKF